MNSDNRNWSIVIAVFAVVISLIAMAAILTTGQPRHAAARPTLRSASTDASLPVSKPLPALGRSLPTPSPVQARREPQRRSRTASPASRSRSYTPMVSNYPTEAQWAALRQCENEGSYRSAPGDYYRGAYQFDYSTWKDVGGTGDPADASPAEQDYRARLLYSERSWHPWPVCGRKYLQ